MSRHSDPDRRQKELYEKIIGLGENSIRKSYYPQLRQKIAELEKSNQSLADEIVERQLKEEEVKRNYEHQKIINSLLKLSLKQLPLEELLQITIDTVLSLSWLSGEATVSVFFIEDTPEILVLKKRHGNPSLPHIHCDRVPFDHCICGQAAQTGKIQFSNHLDEQHTGPDKNDIPHCHYSVPVRLEHITIGVICIYLPEYHTYNTTEAEILEAIANSLAGIIQRKHMADETTKFEQQLRQTQKMEAIGSLSGGIAHDFNNLLSPILGYAELALEELPATSPAAADIREVIKAANLARELVKQILTLSRQSKHELKPLRIHLMLNETLKLLRSSIPSTIEIKNDIESCNSTVLADPTHIHQVVMNLCTNAYHAMKNTGGILAISLKTILMSDAPIYKTDISPGRYQVLEVSDTGKGMDKMTLEKIFDPYFTTKGKDEGTGLGLSVVHGIIKNYGGQITVYSEPGHGSTFKVFFPITSSEKEFTTETEVRPLPTGTEHILIVDDEKAIADMVTSILKNRGYTVTACTSSSDALDRFQQKPKAYSLVITDMTMPHMTGLQLSEQLKMITPDIPIILCTGFSDLINKRKAESYGFKRYLMKPVILRDLCVAVREVLDEN